MAVAKSRLLIFIVAYNAEKTIAQVIRRIPAALADEYDAEVLIIDDASHDETFEKSYETSKQDLPFRIHTLFNPSNQGYGGNQKLGYHYAIEHGYDFVALIHGDGQYAPECLPELLAPLRGGAADAVFGSRMLAGRSALRGGMPLYKFIGNRVLTWIENRLLGTNLSEFHSGYRVYSTRALRSIPFHRNANGFHFDTEIIIQLLIAGQRIVEKPIPTYYGDEICHVNGIGYAWNVVCAACQAALQPLGLLYDRKYDCGAPGTGQYVPKFNFRSTHSLVLDRVAPGARVLDLGCAGGYMAGALAERKQCQVDGVDAFPALEPRLASFYLHDLNQGLPALDYEKYDCILMLDVIEHLTRPEAFLEELYQALKTNPSAEVILSTANIGFVVPRMMLLAGKFNYGKRGILDLTHTRLFTFASFERAVRQAGFRIFERQGVPAPIPLALGDNWISRLLLKLNQLLIHVSRGMFSYQILLRLKPEPSIEYLLKRAGEHSERRIQHIKELAAARDISGADSA